MIQIDRLVKKYDKFKAVDDISLTIRQGEVYAFLGPNGSGKTTTMKSIVGLVVPTSGRVRVHGMDVHSSPKEARRFMSYLPQRVIFPENVTAREIVRLYARLRNLSKDQADNALSFAQFNGFSDKFVGEFSGGMVQRLGLAVVSLPDTPLLLLDEPTASLDPVGVKRFRDFVLDQKAKGKTIVFSTHLLSEVEQLADRVGIFVGGKLVAEETIDTVRSSFNSYESIEDMYLHYINKYDHQYA